MANDETLDDDGSGIDWEAYDVPAPAAGLTDAIMAAVERGAPAGRDDAGRDDAGRDDAGRDDAGRDNRRRGLRRPLLGGAVALAAAAAVALVTLSEIRTPPPPLSGHADALPSAANRTLALPGGVAAELTAEAALSWVADERGLRVEQSAGAVHYCAPAASRLLVATPAAWVRNPTTDVCMEVAVEKTKLRKGAIGALMSTAAVVTIFQGHAALANRGGKLPLAQGEQGVALAGHAPVKSVSGTAPKTATAVIRPTRPGPQLPEPPEPPPPDLDGPLGHDVSHLFDSLGLQHAGTEPQLGPEALNQESMDVLEDQMAPLIADCFKQAFERNPATAALAAAVRQGDPAELEDLKKQLGGKDISFSLHWDLSPGPSGDGLVGKTETTGANPFAGDAELAECLAESTKALGLPAFTMGDAGPGDAKP